MATAVLDVAPPQAGETTAPSPAVADPSAPIEQLMPSYDDRQQFSMGQFGSATFSLSTLAARKRRARAGAPVPVDAACACATDAAQTVVILALAAAATGAAIALLRRGRGPR